jgi:hypothetical protein
MVIAFFVSLVVALCAAVYMIATMPDQKDAVANSLEDFDFPTNSNGRAIPEVFGTKEVSGNVLYYGDMRTSEIKN